MTITTTREVLHRVAAQVLGRRRFQVSGRFGLRASPAGFATPAFGEGPEVLRVADGLLLREVAGTVMVMPLEGASIADMATFAGADLEAPFTPGDDAPELGDPDEPVHIDAGAARRIAAWFDLGWRVLDQVLAAQPPASAPAAIQLWPEHFDAGTSVGLLSGGRVNLGFSPGDGYEPEPYVYVGPEGTERYGEPAFWNAPFGAVLRSSDALASSDPGTACVGFLHQGIDQASSR
jgi:hypothetical protein